MTWESSLPTAAQAPITITPRKIMSSPTSNTFSMTAIDLSAVLSSSTGKFQIPNRAGQVPGIANADGSPLSVNGQTTYPSDALDENQRELNHFAILSWQHSQGAFDAQTSLTARYSSLTFTPDYLGDLLFDGIAQDAYKQNVAYALQSDLAYKLNDSHTLRGGIFLQSDHSKSLTTRRSSPWMTPAIS
jgi:outer membrane receptor for ferrienterochelin and colicins